MMLFENGRQNANNLDNVQYPLFWEHDG